MKRPQWIKAPVPDEHTPTTVLIRHHYEESGLYNGWTSDQVDRLCRLLKVTKRELGELFCIDWTTMRKWDETNYYPPYVALHFVKAVTYYDMCVSGVQKKPSADETMMAEVIANAEAHPPQKDKYE